MQNGHGISVGTMISSFCKITPKAPAFSLMEMMVVMLVVAVVMALSAPMITKKSAASGVGGGGASLMTSMVGGNVGFNLTESNSRGLIIGGKETETQTMNTYMKSHQGTSGQEVPRLSINGKSLGTDSELPQIGFMYGGTATGVMMMASSNRMYIGNGANVAKEDIQNAIAIGGGARATGNNSVSLGKRASAGANSVAIGDTAQASGGIAIGAKQGDDDKTVASGGIAIGANTKAGSGFALGHGANAKGSCDLLGTGASCDSSANEIERSAIKIARTNVLLNGGNKVRVTASNELNLTASNTLYMKGTKTTTLYGSEGVTVQAPTTYRVTLSSNAHVVNYITAPNASFSNSLYGNRISANTISANTISAKYVSSNNISDMSNTIRDHGNSLRSHSNSLSSHSQSISSLSSRISSLSSSISSLSSRISAKKSCSCSSNKTSDIRLKDVIGENLDAMDKIERLKVYNFTFKNDEDKVKHVGVMAQDLMKIFPDAVTKDDEGYFVIRHEDIFYAMVNALKEINARVVKIAEDVTANLKAISENKAQIVELQTRVDKQDKQIKELQAEVAELKKLVKKLAK